MTTQMSKKTRGELRRKRIIIIVYNRLFKLNLYLKEKIFKIMSSEIFLQNYLKKFKYSLKFIYTLLNILLTDERRKLINVNNFKKYSINLKHRFNLLFLPFKK